MKYIITGGPGFGKTSIIKGLNEKGIPFIGETSRHLINELIKKKEEILEKIGTDSKF